MHPIRLLTQHDIRLGRNCWPDKVSSVTRMALKVFYDVMSQPARAVFIFCRANSLNFTPCPVALRKMEQKSEEYTKVNPFQRVPAIQDGDFTLTESFAIMQYLADKYDCSPNWNPPDLEKRARVLEFFSWHHEWLRQPATHYFIEKGIKPRQTGKPPNEEDMQKEWKRVREAFSHMENYFLKNKPFIGGDGISIADLLGACEVMQLSGVDQGFLKDHSVLKAWLHRVREGTNPHFDEGHKFIYKLGKVSDPSAL